MSTNETPTIRIVYDGPGLAGKTSSMGAVQRRLRGATPVTNDLAALGANRLRFTASAPGITIAVHAIVDARHAPSDRDDERAKADAINFVVDSQVPRMIANEERRDAIAESFARLGRVVPVVLQFNKRDLPHTIEWEGKTVLTAPIASTEELSERLNRWGGQEFATVATRDEGVWAAFESAALLAGRVRGLDGEVRRLLRPSDTLERYR